MNEPHKTGEYDAAYHANLQTGARSSADIVMPRVLDLVRPANIVDFGCGSGGWLAAAARLGIGDILGVDGPWVAASTLEIPPAQFLAADLGALLDLGRSFDLALCLEVAEHLPPDAAAELVATLTAHAPVVLFSAAVPGQGGEGHVNEAWPNVWRDRFSLLGFACFDVLRGAIWRDPRVEPWYRQNLLVYASRERLARDRALAARLSQTAAPPLEIVHPAILAEQTARTVAVAEERDRLRRQADDLLERVEVLGRAYEDQRAELERARATWFPKRVRARFRAFARLTAKGRKQP